MGLLLFGLQSPYTAPAYIIGLMLFTAYGIYATLVFTERLVKGNTVL